MDPTVSYSELKIKSLPAVVDSQANPFINVAKDDTSGCGLAQLLI